MKPFKTQMRVAIAIIAIFVAAYICGATILNHAEWQPLTTATAAILAVVGLGMLLQEWKARHAREQ